MSISLKLSNDEKYSLSLNAKSIFDNHRGILAADESKDTINKKLQAYSISQSLSARNSFREILFTTQNLEKYIGAVILNEESYFHKTNNSFLYQTLLKKNISLGIKLDKGLYDFSSKEKITIGINDLENRILKYKDAKFTKWRSLFFINKDLPTKENIEQNLFVLAKFCYISQRHLKVPILEPEIHYENTESLERVQKAASEIYSTLILYLNRLNIHLNGVILKISFIRKSACRGLDLGLININLLNRAIPYDLKNIVFLSGGYDPKENLYLLNEINKLKNYSNKIFSFSFCRTLTTCVMSTWREKEENIEKAQNEFLKMMKKCKLALKGEYKE